MAGKLSFSIAINLLTENFKRGTNNVKSGLREMQMQVLTFVAALGAGGLGLSNFVSRLIDVARETSRVTTALKNVSGGMSQYADNQKFVIDMAKKYGLEVNALTGNFAKFTAASQVSGMSMMDQRKIFESVSRACTAFGMSADDSNGVFLALSQMMSKGKISSEELRLQMGERLPVALQAMAKAAGVSVGELDKLMKQGKLMSKDVLPGFADALNEMIPNVDTDNLEASVNRLKNAFTEFTNGTGIQSAYKGIIDWLTGAVQTAGENIKNIVIGVVAVIVGLIANAATKTIRSWGTATSQIGAISQAANNRALAATAKRVAEEQALEKAKLQQALAVGSQKIIAAEAVAKAEVRLAAATAAEVKAKDIAKAASAQASAVASSSAWGKAYTIMKIGAAKLVASLKAMWNSFAPMIIASAIIAVAGHLYKVYQEAKRIKNIFSEYKKESQLSGYTQEVVVLKQQLKIMNDKKQSQYNINSAQAQLQKMLGVEHKSQEELNKLVAKRVELLKETARADFHARKQVEFEDKNKTLATSVGLSSAQAERLAPLAAGKDTSKQNRDYYYQTMGRMYRENGIEGSYDASAADAAMQEYAENMRVIADSSAELEKSTVNANKLTDTKPLKDSNPDKKKTPLQKEQSSYDKQFAELGAELEIGKITQAEYNKALGDLNIKMYAQAKGTGDKEVLESEYYKIRKAAAEKAVKDQDKNTALVEFEKVQKEYNDKVKEYQVQQSKGLISQKELDENIASLSIEAAKSAAGIKGIGDEADVFITAMQLNAKLLASPIKIKPRDTTFDYKRSKNDIAGETLDKAKELADKYKEEAKAIGQTLSDEVADAMADVPSLEEALKLAEVLEDIKDFSKELDQMRWDGFKGAVSNIEGVVSAFQRLGDAFDPESEATEWERLMAVWNMMTSVVDGMMSIIKTIESITELTNKLTKAKEVEAVVDTTTTATKVTNAVTGAAVETAALSGQTTAEVAASTAKTTAASMEMAAKSAAAYAYIPFAGVGLAGAQIASMKAMILAAAVPFATGGIVGGNSLSGDKILARLNSGEMILNGGQQSNLFDAINSGKLGGNSLSSLSVATKIRSKDLILIINNELKSQGKKPIS